MTDYYTFCERYAQRCAARRAELEEDEMLLRRSSDLRRRDLQEQSEPQPQSSYQLPLTDARPVGSGAQGQSRRRGAAQRVVDIMDVHRTP